MSLSQPPPLRQPPPMATPLAAPPVDVVARIQHANARLAAASAAAARSRGLEVSLKQQQQQQGREAAVTTESPSSSPHPRLFSPQLQAAMQLRQRSASPPETAATASPSSTLTETSVSPPSAYAGPPRIPSSPSRTPRPSASTPPPHDRHVTAWVNMSPAPHDGPSNTATPQPQQPVPTNNVVVEELRQTRQKLEELQRLYNYEKRAHLQQRTRQLRAEAEQRQTDDDVVTQAMQLLTDYEAMLHRRDAERAGELEAVVQRISQEWQRSAAELEQTRAACVASLLSRLEASCAQQRDALESAMRQHMVATAQKSVEAEAQQFQTVATAVQDQVESFKAEYRVIVEQDMEERRRLMDEQAARREQQWLQFLKEEHARMTAAGEAAAREAQRHQLETLHAAMRDITELRENLLKEHTQRQAEVSRDYMDSYERLAAEYATAAKEAAEYVQHLQQEYAGIIQQLHKEVSRAVAAKQAAEQRAREAEAHAQEAVAVQQHAMEAQVEARWQKKLEAEQEKHSAALVKLLRTHEDSIHELQATHNAREASHVAQHEAALSDLREMLAQQHNDDATRADAANDTLRSALRRVEDEKESMWRELLLLRTQRQEEASAHVAELLSTKRTAEERFAAQLQELDAGYAAALEKYKTRAAAAGTEGEASAGVVTSRHALQRVAELEEELRLAQHQHTVAVQEAVDNVTALWSSRLKHEQQRHAEERDVAAAQHRRLRQSLLDEVKERENAAEARCAAQREAHQRELQEAVLAEKRAAQQLLEQLKREFECERSRLMADGAARVELREDAIAERERKLSEAEAAWQRRRAGELEELRQTLLQHMAAEAAAQQRLLDEREARVQAAQDALAKQQLTSTHALRASLQREKEAAFTAQLHGAQQQWMQLMEEEAQQRCAVWQEARRLELEAVHAFHRREVDLLRRYYDQQLQMLRDEQEGHAEQLEREMRARETAWAAERAASLDSYEKAAAERLHGVLAHAKEEWEAALRQRTSTTTAAAADIDSVAQRAAEVLTMTEESRARMANELREMYVAMIHNQELQTAEYLAELHAKHEKEMAALRRDNDERLQEQATQFRAELAKRSSEHDAHLAKVRKSHEEELSALRAAHAQRLAEQRAAAEESLRQTRQQLDDAQHARDSLMKATQRAAEQTYLRELDELQKRCDAQAAQLLRSEADMHAQAQRIREEQQLQLRQEYERSMADLRAALEERNQSYAALQASLYEQVQREAARIQTKMESAYTAFTQEQHKQLADRVEAQEAAQLEQQRRQQEQLACLQQQHETALAAQATKLRAAHNDACERLKSVFEEQQAEWKRLLEAERSERATAEDAVKSLTMQLSQLQVTHAEQQAAAYRALDQEYHHVLEDAIAQLQEEREEVARRSLEAAEQHFLSETIRMSRPKHPYDAEQVNQPQLNPPAFSSTVPQQQPSSWMTSAAASAAASTFSPSRRNSPTSENALLSYACKGLSTPITSHTPHPYASPLPISPAAPVDLVEQAEPLTSSYCVVDGQSPQRVQQEMDLHRLQQLWDVLEVPLDDRHAFLDQIESLSGDAPLEQQRVWKNELQRLEAQLPLLEALTRRNYVARQLRSLRKTAPALSSVSVNAPSASKLQGQRPPQEVKEEMGEGSPAQSTTVTMTAESVPVYDRLADELKRLTVQLQRDVASHESRHGQVFRYHGRRVMEMLGEE
jgi:hypothetical protein